MLVDENTANTVARIEKVQWFTEKLKEYEALLEAKNSENLDLIRKCNAEKIRLKQKIVSLEQSKFESSRDLNEISDELKQKETELKQCKN